MNHTDIDRIRRELAIVGQLFHLGTDAVSVIVAFHCANGMVYRSRQPTEVDCLIDIHDQMKAHKERT